MAVILGNMIDNKKKQETIKANEHNRKLETLKNLIGQCSSLVNTAKDMWDTYHYIKDDIGEKEFSKQLWGQLCRHETIDISSYFGFGMPIYNKKKHCDIEITRFGVSIMYADGKQVHTDKPIWDCNSNDENTWWGKYLLSDYLDKHEVSTEFIDDAISTLEYMIDNFQNYADAFFNKVSSYNAAN